MQVVDAVGAGDAFSAAFLASWLGGASAAAAAEAGNRRGAWVASHRGAVPEEERRGDQLVVKRILVARLLIWLRMPCGADCAQQLFPASETMLWERVL